MNKIYIVTAGCSFTDGYFRYKDSNKISENWLNDLFKKQNYWAVNQIIKYNYFLLMDLLFEKQNFKIINVGRGSAGNHVIKNTYQFQIQKLLDRGIKPENIIGTIQLSGMVRGYIHNPPWYYYNGIENDYPINLDYDGIQHKEIISNHIDNIKDIIDFNKNRNINKFKIFFGWSIFFKKELERYNLYNKMMELDINYLHYIKYEAEWDRQEWVCAGTKNVIKNILGGLQHKHSLWIAGDEFGGMTDYLRSVFTDNEPYYISKQDAHLNTLGNYQYYNDIYKKWFIEWGMVTDTNFIENDEDCYPYLKAIIELSKEQYFCFTEHNIRDQSPPFVNIYLKKYFEEKLGKNKIKYL